MSGNHTPWATAWQTNYTGDEWHFAREASFSPSDIERGIVRNITHLNPSSQAEIERLRTSGREFMEAAEAVFDWMNGNDLSADHEEQHPDDFERVSKALVAFRAALSGSKE